MFAGRAFWTVFAVTGLFLTLSMTELVRTWPQAQAGVVTYERTCPIHTGTAGTPHAR